VSWTASYSARVQNVMQQNSWLQYEAGLSIYKILLNVSPLDSKPGAVVAAQTKVGPNYYFHWVRDAGLTVDAMVTEYLVSRESKQKNYLKQKLSEYIDFSDYIQKTQTLTGLGEPKFNVDGSAYNDPWGRPQNDGPAIRASSLIRWYRVLQSEGISQALAQKLYDGKIPTQSVIKRDLEYVSHHWRDPSFDLWEEVKGDHFYTRMVQRRALLEGAQLAEALGDSGAAKWYFSQSKMIEQDMMSFWDPVRGYFVATKNRVEGLDYKNSNLDISVILGLLHGSMNDGFLPFSDPKVQSTIGHIVQAFSQIYKINKRTGVPGVAIGRYPEDRYGGDNFEGGNPWPLTTLAIAEACYRMAYEYRLKRQNQNALDLVGQGDQFVLRVQYHANRDGSLNEQMHRDTGYMTSVTDLTWNYAAILTTFFARNRAVY
jgi:glucoamylase